MSNLPSNWVFFSGLPRIVGVAGTAVLRALYDLEALGAAEDKGIRVSLSDLSALTGLEWAEAQVGLVQLRELKFLKAFVPDHPAEDCLVRLAAEPTCPQTWNVVVSRSRWGGHLRRLAEGGGAAVRAARRGYRDAEPEPSDVQMRDVIDAYYDNVSGNVGHMVVERIRVAVGTWGAWRVRKVFVRCGELNRSTPTSIPRGLSWCEGELRRWEAADLKAQREKEEEARAAAAESESAGADDDCAAMSTDWPEAWS